MTGVESLFIFFSRSWITHNKAGGYIPDGPIAYVAAPRGLGAATRALHDVFTMGYSVAALSGQAPLLFMMHNTWGKGALRSDPPVA